MHIFTKVLVILNLVLCLILSQYAWVAHAGNVNWRQKYEWERSARHTDKDKLEEAYGELLAIRDANDNQEKKLGLVLASNIATKQALEAWKSNAVRSAEDAHTKVEELVKLTESFTTISASYREGVVSSLQNMVKDLTDRKTGVMTEHSDALGEVVAAQETYAKNAEGYRRLEFQQFLIQEELEHRLDTKARYRWLRPDIQRELGDNGPVIFANVGWVVGNSLQLNKGKRNGVELHQKYTITRGGSTIAIVDVVEVQNETCECVIIDLVNKSAPPKSGDGARTRLFMSRFGR